ncbi:type VI secretion system protein TssA [Thaumasiovibrio sp. DFM-14]|uniref:type VI secretion system protein TssA n=1 Tax=Thaumasiovibrio sp. DFM-14 TaxID=3384792 RepID=UPI0039A06928
MILIEDLVKPISDSEPSGYDAKYELCFEIMEAETRKFGSLFGETVDWSTVSENAIDVLQNHSKDLKAVSYLTRAWYESFGLAGVKNGLELMSLVLSEFGDSVFPRRKRAREGALEWLIRHLEGITEDVNLVTLDVAVIDEICSLCRSVSFIYDDAFPNAEISLLGLIEPFYRLSTRAMSDQIHDDERASSLAKPEPVSSALPADVKENVVKEKGSSEISHEIEECPAVVSTMAQPTLPVEIDTDFSRPNLAKGTLERVAHYVFSQSAGHPLAYLINRYVSWADIDELPSCDEKGKTPLYLAISADSVSDIESSFQQSQDVSVCQRLEKSLVNAPFWLTGQKMQYEFLQQLGYDVAAQMVASQTREFVKAFPGLVELTFADGRPFADEMTKIWLERTQDIGGALSASTLDMNCFQIEEVTQDNLGEVMYQAASMLNDATSERDRFMVNLNLAQLLHQANLSHLCWPYLELIWPIREEVNLEAWEPQLASQHDLLVASVVKATFGERSLAPEKYQRWLSN